MTIAAAIIAAVIRIAPTMVGATFPDADPADIAIIDIAPDGENGHQWVTVESRVEGAQFSHYVWFNDSGALTDCMTHTRGEDGRWTLLATDPTCPTTPNL